MGWRHLTIASALAITAVGRADDSQAQSLGEIAQKEADRRGTVLSPGKVYTNANLTPDFTKPPAPVAPATGEAGAIPAATGDATAGSVATVASPDAAAAPPAAAGQPGDAQDEESWRSQSQAIRARLETQNGQVEQLRAVLASFRPGAQSGDRVLIQQTLQRAAADLKVTSDEWLAFQRSARERKIPDSWIR